MFVCRNIKRRFSEETQFSDEIEYSILQMDNCFSSGGIGKVGVLSNILGCFLIARYLVGEFPLDFIFSN
jgi:hypothetical protein